MTPALCLHLQAQTFRASVESLEETATLHNTKHLRLSPQEVWHWRYSLDHPGLGTGLHNCFQQGKMRLVQGKMELWWKCGGRGFSKQCSREHCPYIPSWQELRPEVRSLSGISSFSHRSHYPMATCRPAKCTSVVTFTLSVWCTVCVVYVANAGS